MDELLHFTGPKSRLSLLAGAVAFYAVPLFSAAPYGSIPMSFEPNQGQAAATVRFVARGANSSVLIRDSGPQLRLTSATGREQTLAISFAGSANAARPVPESRLSGTVNYFMGKDRSKWLSAVPTFGQVR